MGQLFLGQRAKATMLLIALAVLLVGFWRFASYASTRFWLPLIRFGLPLHLCGLQRTKYARLPLQRDLQDGVLMRRFRLAS